jgi:hypothetical protein
MTLRAYALLCVSAWLACITSGVADAAGAPTPLPAPAQHEFHFVVLGDSQFDDPAAFNRMIDDIGYLAPAFVIQVGDMIEGYLDDLDAARAEWARFKDQIAPLAPISYLPVPGNHDLYNASRRADQRLESLYREQWGAPYYAFAYRNATFIVLNSDAPGEERRIGPEQWRWLEGRLQQTESEHIFVFMHRPPRDLANADQLHALLKSHPVRYVFYGHHHHYHFARRDGIGYVMTNAAADGGTRFDAAGNFDHLLQVSVRDSRVSYAVVRADAVEAPDYVHPNDNYDLYALTRNLAPAAVALQKRGEQHWTMNFALNNPTTRDLTIYVQCGSDDERWHHEPRRLAPVNLAGKTHQELTITWTQRAARVSESAPFCELRVPLQTVRGDWLEHRHTVAGNLAD